MLRGRGHSLKNLFERGTTLYFHAAKHAPKGPTIPLARGVSERTDITPALPSVFRAPHEYPAFRPYNWRDANWGLIGGFLFSAFCWWAIFTLGFPAFSSVLNFLFLREAV